MGVLLVAIVGIPAVGEPQGAACVGDPPRQIEDPLGPPCIVWDGTDNGGSTWKGVTGDSITVVLYNDLGIEGDMNAPYDPSQENGLQTDYYYRDLVRTTKAQLRSFAERMETYGREVRVIAVPSGGGLATLPEQRRGEIAIIDHEYDPFAIVFLGGNAQNFFAVAADRQIFSFGMLSDVPREVFLDGEPYIWSLLPDQETHAALSAGFMCGKLAGRSARFTDDPTLQGKPRTFGLLYEQQSQRGPQLTQLAAALQQEFLDRCGRPFDLVRPFGGGQSLASAIAAMAAEGITTLVCYCIPQQSELHAPQAQAVASGLGYRPEWFWDPASGMDKVLWLRQHANPLQPAFGTTSYWRQPELHDQYHYRAFQAMDPDGSPNLRWNFELYHGFLSLFAAIQLSGPTLDPVHVWSGMTTWTQRNTAAPFTVVGGHEQSKENPFSFIDTGMGWWWDALGSEPGASLPPGCMRVADEGRRFSADGWTAGDADLLVSTDPCTAAPITMLDP